MFENIKARLFNEQHSKEERAGTALMLGGGSLFLTSQVSGLLEGIIGSEFVSDNLQLGGVVGALTLTATGAAITADSYRRKK